MHTILQYFCKNFENKVLGFSVTLTRLENTCTAASRAARLQRETHKHQQTHEIIQTIQISRLIHIENFTVRKRKCPSVYERNERITVKFTERKIRRLRAAFKYYWAAELLSRRCYNTAFGAVDTSQSLFSGCTSGQKAQQAVWLRNDAMATHDFRAFIV